MYSYEPLPFHKTCHMDPFLEEAKILEQEREWMYSCLPKEYRDIQKKAEEVCDKMEYEGSRMYDAHPDKEMLRHMARKIMKEVVKDDQITEDMVCCFLGNEILRRRSRSWFVKRYIR